MFIFVTRIDRETNKCVDALANLKCVAGDGIARI